MSLFYHLSLPSMKKLLLFLLLLPFAASAQQTYWPSAPSGSSVIPSVTYRQIGMDSTRRIIGYWNGFYNEMLTRTNANFIYARLGANNTFTGTITANNYTATNNGVNFTGFGWKAYAGGKFVNDGTLSYLDLNGAPSGGISMFSTAPRIQFSTNPTGLPGADVYMNIEGNNIRRLSDNANVLWTIGDNYITGNQSIDGTLSVSGNITTGNGMTGNNILANNSLSAVNSIALGLPAGQAFQIVHDVAGLPSDVELRSTVGSNGIRIKANGDILLGKLYNNMGVRLTGNNLYDVNNIPFLKQGDVPDSTAIANTYVPKTRTLTGGYGINTIGDLSVNRTISADTTSSTGLVSKSRLTNALNLKQNIISQPANQILYSNGTSPTSSNNLMFASNKLWVRGSAQVGPAGYTGSVSNVLTVADSSANGLVGFQNKSAAGYSSFDLYDNTGGIAMSFGHANASATAFANQNYINNTYPLLFAYNASQKLLLNNTQFNVSNGVEQAWYNTTAQTGNFEKGVAKWVGNEFIVGTDFGGTGTAMRAARFGAAGTTSSGINRTLNVQGGVPFFSFTWGGTGLGGSMIDIGGNNTLSGNNAGQRVLGITPTMSQVGTSTYTGIFQSPFLSGNTASGAQLFFDFGTNSAAAGGGTHSSVIRANFGGRIDFNATASTANQVYGVNAAGTGSEAKTITAGSGISITNGAGTITVAATITRTAALITGNTNLSLNTDYLNTTSTQHIGTLPATTGFVADGTKVITVLSTGANGTKVIVPAGYTLTGPSGAATPGTGGVVVPKDGKCQFIPVGNNAYQYAPIGLSVTVS
jgi:hypothetical protein